MSDDIAQTREQIAARRIERMRERLQASLAPELLEITDDGHRHVGHAGAADGHGHFTVLIVGSAFAGLNPLARHRAVYEALGDMMQTDIHALRIDASAAVAP